MDSNGLNNCKLIKDFNECNNMISTEKNKCKSIGKVVAMPKNSKY
jgi:hypothetical protein